MKKLNRIIVFALAVVLALGLTISSTAVAVPSGVTPSKAYTTEVGKTYSLPADAKLAGDVYTPDSSGVLTVDSATGIFNTIKAGEGYIIATNGGQSRYIKVTVGGAAATPAVSALAGYNITVYDSTTAATHMGSKHWQSPIVYFYSLDNKVLGSISVADSLKLQQDNYNRVKAEMGADFTDLWLIDQFNVYRGLSLTARIDVEAKRVEEYRAEVFRLINIEREKAGLSALQQNAYINAIAQIRAEEIKWVYSHVSPNGTTSGWENIGRGNYTPEQVVAGWMASEGHRNNILSPGSSASFVGAAYLGVGVYNYHGSYTWVLTFGGNSYDWDNLYEGLSESQRKPPLCFNAYDTRKPS